MTKHPLTLAQATALCEEYDYLKDRKFGRRSDATIQFLAIAPYDDINQHILMSQLQDVTDYQKALEDYEGCLFDVIVIARSPDVDGQFIYKRLGDYLGEMNGKDKDVVYNVD
jgi:hypothetical protein